MNSTKMKVFKVTIIVKIEYNLYYPYAWYIAGEVDKDLLSVEKYSCVAHYTRVKEHMDLIS